MTVHTSVAPFLAAAFCGAIAVPAAYALDSRINRPRGRVALLVLFVLLAIALAEGTRRLSGVDLTTHITDSALVVNIIWNTIHGRPWYSDLHGMNKLGHHSYINMILLAPVYFISSSVAMFEFVQSLYVFASAFLVFGLARRIIGDTTAAATLAIVYLLYPPLAGWAVGAVQPGTLAVPFLLAALWAWEAERVGIFIALALVGAMSWESSLLGVPLLGVACALLRPKDRRSALTLTALGALLAAAFFLVIRPALAPPGVDHISVARHYSALGGTAGAIVKNLLTNPSMVASVVLIPGKIGFLGHVLLPWMGLFLFAPMTILPALPEFAMLLLCNPGEDMYKVNGFYSEMITIFTLWGSLRGAMTLRGLLPARWDRAAAIRALATGLLVLGLGLQLCYNHTLGRDLPAKLEALATRSPNVAPEPPVPEGARVLLNHGGLARLFPRQRILFPDAYLHPVARRNFFGGDWTPEYFCFLESDEAGSDELIAYMNEHFVMEDYFRGAPGIVIRRVVGPR